MLRALVFCFAFASTAAADPLAGAVELDVLPGWRTEQGTHMAGLRMQLGPGWKTYWRAPGDAGIPPSFSWRGSRNVDAVRFHWPVPEIHDQNGMQTLGYSEQVVIPMEFTPDADGDIRLRGRVEIGVCREVCIPVSLDFAALLSTEGGRDAQIAAALVDQPMSAGHAGVTSVACRVAPTDDGIALEARIAMPALAREEVVVVEVPGAPLWIGETRVDREGTALVARTEIAHVEGAPFALDRGDMRITVLGGGQAVDIHGCPAP